MDYKNRSRRSMSVERSVSSTSDTLYHSSRIMDSRMSSFGTTASSTPMTTSPPPVNGLNGHAPTNYDGDNQFDPEQFTPTLHTSLVSKILSLQQELESKRSYIEEIENSLSSSRSENDSIRSSLRVVSREKQSLESQVRHIEQSTLSAAETLSEERDKHKDANIQLRQRLDASQKKLRTQEQDTARFKNLLEQEQKSAALNKLSLDKRADLAEKRLQDALGQLAAIQIASEDNSEVRDYSSRPASSAAERMITRSPDFKRLSPRKHKQSVDSLYETKPSLADELGLDGAQDERTDDEEPPQTPPQRTGSSSGGRMETEPSSSKSNRVGSSVEDRRTRVSGLVSAFESQQDSVESPSSRQSLTPSRTFSEFTRKLHSSSSKPVPETRLESPLLQQAVQEEREEQPLTLGDRDVRKTLHFLRAARTRSKSEPILVLESVPSNVHKVREWVTTVEETTAKIEPEISSQVSQGTQTSGSAVNYIDHSIQTEAPPRAPAPPRRPPPPVPDTGVPAIAIQSPALSSPSLSPRTRRGFVHPSRGRNAAVQTEGTDVKSAAVQTDVIRIDRRPVKLPAHLLPSALDEKEAPKPVIQKLNPGTKLRRTEPLKLTDQESEMIARDRNLSPQLPPLHERDDEEKEAEAPENLIRPDSPTHELGNAGQNDDLSESDAGYASENPHRSGQTSIQPTARNKRPTEPKRSISNERNSFSASVVNSVDRWSINSGSARSSVARGKRPSQHSTGAELAPSSSTGLNLNALDDKAHSRSPSMGSAASSSNYSKASGPRPPFMIPTRKSSREHYAKIRIQRGGLSPNGRSRSGRSSPTKRGKGSQRFPRRAQNSELRKSRSEAELQSWMTSEQVPALPPLPATRRFGDHIPPPIAASRSSRDLRQQHGNGLQAPIDRRALLSPTSGASVSSAMHFEPEEALAAACVGDWVFKYMRSRSTFTMPMQSADGGKTSETRHKRYVWLLPQQRTVLWSRKQPTSPAALAGKGAKKIIITTVHDVRDDTPPPKEAKTIGIFNRSIVIQSHGRGLKLTALTKERHYLWMTALSNCDRISGGFQNVPKLMFQAPPPTAVEQSTTSSGRSRASSFRNHLRGGRSKVSSAQTSGAATPVVTNRSEIASRQNLPRPSIPDSASAPAIPRVPHARKRSLTGPTRGRSGNMGGALCGYPNPVSHPVPPTSAYNSSARLPSVSAASAQSAVAETDAVSQDRSRTSNATPRPSETGAEFGGNTNFFDAASVMQMDAFSKGHTRQESSGSFIGPPDIERARK